MSVVLEQEKIFLRHVRRVKTVEVSFISEEVDAISENLTHGFFEFHEFAIEHLKG